MLNDWVVNLVHFVDLPMALDATDAPVHGTE